jgi:hypothetical protein
MATGATAEVKRLETILWETCAATNAAVASGADKAIIDRLIKRNLRAFFRLAEIRREPWFEKCRRDFPDWNWRRSGIFAADRRLSRATQPSRALVRPVPAIRRPAAPRRRRCSARPAAAARGQPAEPDPEPSFAWPLFYEPGDPPPLPEPDVKIMRVIRRSPLWAHVDAQVRTEILAIARHTPFGPSAAAAIDRRLELAALDADRNPQSWGDLWLPGMPLPIDVLTVRNSWGFWRSHIDIADHTEWYCWGGRA